MCIEDWRIGRLIRTKRTTFINVNGNTLTFLPDKDRVFFAVGIDIQATQQAFRLQIKVDGLIFTSLNNNVTLFRCTYPDFGELPTFQWDLVSIGVSFQGAVIEGFLPEAVLRDNLERYKRSY